MSSRRPVYYADYLGIKTLLSSQRPLSKLGRKPAHDERTQELRLDADPSADS